MSTIEVVVGAQFGSEGKGHVTAQRILALQVQGQEVFSVRVAGPNAGHCVIDPENGHKYAFRCLPVGAALGATCVIAAGSEVDLDVLTAEVHEVNAQGRSLPKFYVDGEATLLTRQHINEEQASDLNARAGSTAKGIGAARADRIWRTALRVKDDIRTIEIIQGLGGEVLDTQTMLRTIGMIDKVSVVIEGTQGYGLGLHAGLYPQSTSSDCRAIDFLAMAGLSPWSSHVEDFTVWLATRVYPIRVAGNSGPLKGETSWDELKLEKEYTTVTKKERRVGEWDADLVKRAVQANGGGNQEPWVKLALTMVDQKFPNIAGWDWASADAYGVPQDLQDWMKEVSQQTGARVGMVTTSPDTAFYVDLMSIYAEADGEEVAS